MKKRYKVITTITIINMIITVLSAFISIILPYIMLNIYTIDFASLVKVIASPDGPTALYIAGKSNSYIFPLVFGILSITGIIYLYVNREKEAND